MEKDIVSLEMISCSHYSGWDETLEELQEWELCVLDQLFLCNNNL